MSRQAKQTQRVGSTLIMVLVVMIVVGLIVSQTSQLLTAFHTNDRLHRNQQQARELIELGIVQAGRALARDVDYAGGAFLVDVWDTSRIEGDFLASKQGRIQIEMLKSSSPKNNIRVTVSFPVGQPGEVVSTWDSSP